MSDRSPSEEMDTLSKMDALLRKHRGGEARHDAPARPADSAMTGAPADAWLPVLTKVLERGTPPAIAQPDTAALPPAEPAVPPPPVEPASIAPEPAETAIPAPVATEPVVSDTLAEQLMSELAPRLSEVMEKQVAAELRRNLDQTVSSLLSQLDVNVREIVREAVAEKLRQRRDPSA